MKAVQLVAHGAPGRFELRELPEPQPGSGEVVVRMRACGMNHLDLWLEEAGLPVTIPLPRTPGCEIAGEVLETGAAVSGWKAGDRVAVQSNLYCGECEYCKCHDGSVSQGEGHHIHGARWDVCKTSRRIHGMKGELFMMSSSVC